MTVTAKNFASRNRKSQSEFRKKQLIEATIDCIDRLGISQTTLARIADWYQGSDGLLGITAIGEERFRLLQSERQDNGLQLGEVKRLDTEPSQELADDDKPLAHILAGVLDDLGKLYESLDKNYDDAGWVADRFAEILPISPEQKQNFLVTEDPLKRLKMIRKVLASVRDPGAAGC